MNTAAASVAGIAVGAAATWGASRLMVDEHVPSRIAPVAGSITFAAGAGAATWLAKSSPMRGALTGIAAGSILAGAALVARPELIWNTHGGVMDGVYQPERLIIENEDVHATGQVTHVGFAGDGDIHIELRPDARYASYVRGARPRDTLVLEPVPGDQDHIPVPHVGDRIAVDGPLVWDSTHGHNEVHPVRTLEILQADGPRRPRDLSEVTHEQDAEEEARERTAFIGGGVALAGLGLLTAGAWKASHGVAKAGLNMAHAGTPGWTRAICLIGLGGAAVLAGALIGGQNKD